MTGLDTLLRIPAPPVRRRGRDSQRGKLYAAERTLHTYVGKTERRCTAGGRLETIDDMQRFVNTITTSAWYRRHYPRGPSGIFVRHGGGCGSARAVGNAIEMPGWSRCRLIVLHEVAHCVAGRAGLDRDGAHGRGYVRTYLALVERFLGADWAKRLRAAFRAGKVRWCPRRPEARVTAGNPEALAAWRAARDKGGLTP